MEKEMAQQLAKKNLAQFKRRMKIFSSSEDEYLSDILAASYRRIEELIGPYNPDDDLNFTELVFERGRYAYNDQIEYFEGNFQSYFLDYSLDQIEMGDEDDTPKL